MFVFVAKLKIKSSLVEIPMNKINRLYYKRCLSLGLNPVFFEKHKAGFYITLGHQYYYFNHGFTPFNDMASVTTCINKCYLNRILKAAQVPVPKAIAITREDYRKNKWDLENITFPVVAKPTYASSCGRNVVCNIKNRTDLIQYLDKFFLSHTCVSIEEFHSGLKSYRILVFQDKIIGLIERTPAHVLGDGVKSIRELIHEKNILRKKLKKSVPTGNIDTRQETKTIFEELGIDYDYVPAKDEHIPLRYICNATQGGTFKSLDVQTICPENWDLAVRTARILNLNLAGLDLICEDISIPIENSKGFIIEANVDPDITIHENALEGPRVLASKIMIQSLIRKHFISYLLDYFKKHHFLSVLLKTSCACTLVFACLWGLRLYA